MNIHPILVHFPIALLSVYSILECIRFKKVLKQDYWFYVKAIFLLIGTLALIPTGLAGKLIESQFTESQALIEIHSSFAIFSTLTFSFLSALYLLHWLGKVTITNKNFVFLKKLITLQSYIFTLYIIVPLAILGLMLISLTGALGGIIVYGPHLDIFTEFVYGLFFK